MRLASVLVAATLAATAVTTTALLTATAPLDPARPADLSATATSAGAAGSVVVRYAAPLPGPLRVVRPFVAPAGPYGPGHRGVDLAASRGTRVRTAAGGTVTFAGSVAGRGVVVVAHPDGVRTEYEPVRPAVRRGQPLRGGAVLGTVQGRHAGCAGSCLHWGARRGDVYLDPLLLLRLPGPVRLLPWTT